MWAKAVIFYKQEPRSTLQVEAWYGTAEMMEMLKWEERAEANSSPVAAGSSVSGVSTLLWAVKLSGNVPHHILF